MSATNSTSNINLPLFIGTDKPSWLVDWNGAMNAIDAAIASLQAAESGTSTALASLAQSLEALSGTVGQHTTALQTLTTAVSGNTGSINTINSLIGNGKPTTTDKTIIGAINEINAKIPEGGEVAADDVTYDNQTSGLQATNVQAAIDEVNAKIPQGGSVDAEDVAYDNTQSGLAATDVQAAIDELANTSAPTLFGTPINITTGHESSGNNPYEFPSDGYLTLTSGTTTQSLIQAVIGGNDTTSYVADGNYIFLRAAGTGTQSVWNSILVKKGFKVFINTSGSESVSARFVPFA